MILFGFVLGAIGMYICLCRAVQMRNANNALVAKYTLRFSIFAWFIVGPVSGFDIPAPALVFGTIYLIDVLLSFFNWRAYALRKSGEAHQSAE